MIKNSYQESSYENKDKKNIRAMQYLANKRIYIYEYTKESE